jgi:hypothetical protein
MFSVRQDHTKQLGIVCAMAYVYIRKMEKRHCRKQVCVVDEKMVTSEVKI